MVFKCNHMYSESTLVQSCTPVRHTNSTRRHQQVFLPLDPTSRRPSCTSPLVLGTSPAYTTNRLQPVAPFWICFSQGRDRRSPSERSRAVALESFLQEFTPLLVGWPLLGASHASFMLTCQGLQASFTHRSICLSPPGVCRAPDLPAARQGQAVRDRRPCGFVPADHPAAAGAGGGAAAAPRGERGRSGEGAPWGSRYCPASQGGPFPGEAPAHPHGRAGSASPPLSLGQAPLGPFVAKVGGFLGLWERKAPLCGMAPGLRPCHQPAGRTPGPGPLLLASAGPAPLPTPSLSLGEKTWGKGARTTRTITELHRQGLPAPRATCCPQLSGPPAALGTHSSVDAPQSPPPPGAQCPDTCTVRPPRARGQAQGLWGAGTEGVLGRSHKSREPGGCRSRRISACCMAAPPLTREPAGGFGTVGCRESKEVPESSGVPFGARSGNHRASPAAARHRHSQSCTPRPSLHRKLVSCREHRPLQGTGAVAGHLRAQKGSQWPQPGMGPTAAR